MSTLISLSVFFLMISIALADAANIPVEKPDLSQYQAKASTCDAVKAPANSVPQWKPAQKSKTPAGTCKAR